MATKNKKGLSFGIIGPGLNSMSWARTLHAVGGDFWYYSPDPEDSGYLFNEIDGIDVRSSPPYFFDGYTDALIFAGECSEKRDNDIIEALEAGVSVICEPPLTRSWEIADLFVSTAGEKEVCLLEAFKTLHTKAFQQAAYWMQNNLGEVEAIFVTWADTDRDADPLWDVMPEPLSFIEALFEETIADIGAERGKGWARATFGHENGATVTIHTLAGAPEPHHEIVFLGSEGSIVCRPFQHEVVLRNTKDEIIQSHSIGGGIHNSILYMFSRQIIRFQEYGEEMPYGELGLLVTRLLHNIEDFLNEH